MKKQIFSLMLSASILTVSPLFAMEPPEVSDVIVSQPQQSVDPEALYNEGEQKLQSGNRPEAIRLFMSANTFQSQHKMRSLIIGYKENHDNVTVPAFCFTGNGGFKEEKGDFQRLVKECRVCFEELLGEHLFKLGLYKEDSGFSESKFAVPLFALHYETLEKTETKAINILVDLSKSKPGFMINILLPEHGDINFQGEIEAAYQDHARPFLAASFSFVTFGEENTQIKKTLYEKYHIDESKSSIEQIFTEAEKAFGELRSIHLTSFQCALGKLDLVRGDKQKFDKQKERVMTYQHSLDELDEQIKQLELGKKKLIDLLIGKGVEVRNYEFMEAHPYLREGAYIPAPQE